MLFARGYRKQANSTERRVLRVGCNQKIIHNQEETNRLSKYDQKSYREVQKDNAFVVKTVEKTSIQDGG